jgi:AcrR family transcriptional regulator
MLQHRRLAAEQEPITDPSPAAEVAFRPLPRPDPRKRLLHAMIATVAARGYDRTTVSRVLLSADLQEAVFSEHFRDKYDCFMQAVDDLIGRAERSALEQFQGTTPWYERLQIALESLLRALADDPDSARVLIVEMLAAGPEADERQRSALGLFTSLVEQGRIASEETDHLPPQTSEAIVGGIASIVHRRVLQGSTSELPSLHADLAYFALLPYLGQERALTVTGLDGR